MEFIGLDIETAPVGAHPTVFALQPWRHPGRDKVEITAISIARPTGESDISVGYMTHQPLLNQLRGRVAVLWNGVFDLAWLIAADMDLDRIAFVDGMLLWKWAANSQRTAQIPNWSLEQAVNAWCLDEPWATAFLNMKQEDHAAGDDREYWETRCKLDAFATVRIATKIWGQLTPKQQLAAKLEAACLRPVAASWLRGLHMDVEKAAAVDPVLTQEMQQIESQLSVLTCDLSEGYVPSKILSSPKKLGELLFKTWGLEPNDYSEKTGAPSTDKASLTYLADHDDRILSILRWRELNTQRTKFIQGVLKCAEYLNEPVAHPQPRIFSTYTGRMTYASRSGSKGEAAKARIGVPIHQWPRPKDMRTLITAPPGKVIVELDASGQESRIMCIFSGDPTMTRIFSDGLDIHSYTGAEIAGISYEAFMKGKAEKNQAIVGPHGLRNQGKFTNLSNLYRIGPKKLRIKARVEYGMDVDFLTVRQWQETFFRTYGEIRTYWQDAIHRAKTLGYAETLAGRRFVITEWENPDMLWSSESSAINFPIQGTGADMKELGIAAITTRFPHVEFAMDLHDGLFFYLDETDDYKSTALEMQYVLNNLPYEDAWGWEPAIPLPWDVAVGKTWGEKEEL